MLDAGASSREGFRIRAWRGPPPPPFADTTFFCFVLFLGWLSRDALLTRIESSKLSPESFCAPACFFPALPHPPPSQLVFSIIFVLCVCACVLQYQDMPVSVLASCACTCPLRIFFISIITDMCLYVFPLPTNTTAATSAAFPHHSPLPSSSLFSLVIRVYPCPRRQVSLLLPSFAVCLRPTPPPPLHRADGFPFSAPFASVCMCLFNLRVVVCLAWLRTSQAHSPLRVDAYGRRE